MAIQINISMDAGTADTYTRIRRGGNWDTLIKNLEFIGEKRVEGKVNSLTLNFTVQSDNYRDLTEFVKLAKRVHADHARMEPLRNWGTWTNEEFEKICLTNYSDGTINEELTEYLQHEIFKDLVVTISSWIKERI